MMDCSSCQAASGDVAVARREATARRTAIAGERSCVVRRVLGRFALALGRAAVLLHESHANGAGTDWRSDRGAFARRVSSSPGRGDDRCACESLPDAGERT